MSKEAIKHFSKHDPVLAAAAKRVGVLAERKNKRSRFEALVESIVSQQLSVKASDTIFKRFVALFPKGKFPKAEAVLQLTIPQFRAVGISESKANYILDLASNVASGELKLRSLDKLDDEAVIAALTKVKGIGRWTAEMFLMFSLSRPDVFSYGDLGLRNAIAKLYKFKHSPTQKQIEKIISKWSPHKTMASRYLWKSLDNK